jgi:DNA-binding IscR family transcriptional regulator
MARSVNTNLVVVRRITGSLARAGLIRVKRRPGRAKLVRAPEEITLGDIW